MRSNESRYVKTKNDGNQWREIPIHESNLVIALEFALRQTTQLKASEVIERVIVGEPANGIYPLSVAILKKKEE